MFLPVSFRGLSHVFGRLAKPIGFSIVQITENLFSLTLIAEMNVGGLGAHGMKQSHFNAGSLRVVWTVIACRDYS
jgi:hypothetical protein